MVYRIKKDPQENLLLSLIYHVESLFGGREVLVESLFFSDVIKILHLYFSWTWWHIPGNPRGSLRKEDCRFETNLSNLAIPV